MGDDSERHNATKSVSRNPIRALRRTYLLFLVGSLLGLALIVVPLGGEEVGWTVYAVCEFAFVGLFTAAVKYGLGYSWGYAVTTLVVCFVPLFSLILIVILDRRLYLASRHASSVPPDALRLAAAVRGASYVFLLIDLAVLLLLGVFISMSRPRFREAFLAFGGDVPPLTLFLLRVPLWTWRVLLGTVCLVLGLVQSLSRRATLRLSVNLAVGLSALAAGLLYWFATFGQFARSIPPLAPT